MNERLRELAEQAGLQPYYDAQQEQIERFAELIVMECLELLGPESAYGKGHIKKHFGVEI